MSESRQTFLRALRVGQIGDPNSKTKIPSPKFSLKFTASSIPLFEYKSLIESLNSPYGV